jgi:hypothetical protein
VALIDRLCGHDDPVVAYRARRLLAGESESSRALRRLRRAIGPSEMAQRLLLALNGERFNPYRKWQGPHWTLYSLAEIGFPAGDERLLPLRQRVMDWMFAPAFLKPPSTVVFPDQPWRPRRFYDVLSALLVMAEMGMVRDRRCRDALDQLERKRLADGTFPVEWTSVTKADRITTRGTYADWGTLHKKRGHPLVTVDALYVLREAGRAV